MKFITYALTAGLLQFIDNQGFKCQLHFEVSLFHVSPKFYYFQIQLLQKNYLGVEPVFPDIPSWFLVVSS